MLVSLLVHHEAVSGICFKYLKFQVVAQIHVMTAKMITQSLENSLLKQSI